MKGLLRSVILVASSAVIPLLAACHDGSQDSAVILFAAEGEDLNAYDASGDLEKQAVISGNEDESKPDIPAVNGPICFAPDGARRFVIADDATQPNPPPGWSVLELRGDRVGNFSVSPRRARLIPSYQGGVEGADPYGCGFLSDGRLLTSDIGNNSSGPATGQLIVWFPPLEGSATRYCKLDVEIGTTGGIFVDQGDRIYVASARVAPGIHRYSGPFPTSDDAAGGCGRRDAEGAPLADAVQRELFIPSDQHAATPNGVVGTKDGHFYVSSIINGVIAEYDQDGKFVRRILEAPRGETLGARPYSTGTPLGLAIDSHGTVYYADLGLILTPDGFGPGPRLGTVRRIRFGDGRPLPPETIDSGLRFPDGVGVLES